MNTKGAARPQTSAPGRAADQDRVAGSGRGRLPKVTHMEKRGPDASLAIAPDELRAVFGVDDPEVAAGLLSQLVNATHPGGAGAADLPAIYQTLALVQGIGPQNTLEAMTATMLVATEHVALDAMRRAVHPEQTPGGRQIYAGSALKAMRTFAQLLETLNRGRGNGTTQQIIVKHLSIESGGQAIVGALATGRGGDAKS